MDSIKLIEILFLIIFVNNIVLTDSVPSNFLQYFSVPTPPSNPLLDWLNRRRTRKPTIRKMCDSCTCGLTNDYDLIQGDEKIVGGYETRKNQYPWIALLKYNNIFYCGGTLITDRHVLTAAHCARGFMARRILVKFLIHNRTSEQYGATEEKGIERKVKQILVNNKFNLSTFDSDIAILILDQPVSIDHQLRPVCLPNTKNTTIENLDDGNYNETEIATIIGWGALSEQGPLSETLQEVQVPIISNEECRHQVPITNNMFCAGIPEGHKDSCQGDSGGPLMIERQGRYIQIGIVSWGDGCGRPGKPGVYTSISNYIRWIRRNTRDGCFCK